MKLIWHILIKDLRHLWPWLVLWWAALALLNLVDYWNQHYLSPSGSLANSHFIYIFLWCLVLALPFYLVGDLVDADSPLDDRTLWRTLPVNGLRLLTAKAAFLLLFCVPAPFLITLATYNSKSSWDLVARACLPWLIFSAFGFVLLFLAASFFRKPIIGFAVLGALLPVLAAGSYFIVPIGVPSPIQLLATAFLLSVLFAGPVALAIVYRYRRRGFAAACLGFGFLLAVTARAFSILNS